jgi:hypothetical protein
MSDIQRDKTKGKKDTYASKHDFEYIPISKLLKTVVLAYKARKPLAIVGPAGIGKTSIIEQAAKKLGKTMGIPFGCTTLIASQKLPEDFTGIPIPDMEERVVDFLKLRELPRDGHGLLFLDEMNQADSTVLRALFELLGSRKIGTYKLPDNWNIVAAMNPDGKKYQTTKPTPALRRRLSWVEVGLDVHAFITYAKDNNFHPSVVEYLMKNNDKILNEVSLESGKVFSNPAAWEHISDIIGVMGPDDHVYDLLPLGSGYIGKKFMADFIKYFESYHSQIDPKDILNDYNKVSAEIQSMRDQGRLDYLVQLGNSVVFTMLDIDVKGKDVKKQVNNFRNFFRDLPDDTAIHFNRKLAEEFQNVDKIEDKNFWQGQLLKDNETREKVFRLLDVHDAVEAEQKD